METAMNITEEMDLLYRPYNFEEDLDLSYYVLTYWSSCFIIVPIYMLLILAGKAYMKTRKGFSLQKPLCLWSFCLAVFSIMGAVRTWSYMGTLWHMYSPVYTVCFSEFTRTSVIKFWSSIFTFSKVIELGDTAFIILRKRPLIFVHWYHHSTVLIFTSFVLKKKVPAGGWFMTMNFGVHAIMYTYYTLKAVQVKPPKILPMLITSLQIMQMVIGVVVSILAYIWRQEYGCFMTEDELFWCAILYMSYFILFANFFLRTYIMPKNKAKIKSQ